LLAQQCTAQWDVGVKLGGSELGMQMGDEQLKNLSSTHQPE
jgi:hypothetical protein